MSTLLFRYRHFMMNQFPCFLRYHVRTFVGSCQVLVKRQQNLGKLLMSAGKNCQSVYIRTQLRRSCSSLCKLQLLHQFPPGRCAFHKSNQNKNLEERNRNNFVKFIETEEDREKFVSQVQNLLHTSKFMTVANQESKTNLERLCHFFLELKCDCDKIYRFIAKNPEILKINLNDFCKTVRWLADNDLYKNSVLKTLDQSPHLWKLSVESLSRRFDLLRRIGVQQSEIPEVIFKWPHILTVKKERIHSVVTLLKKSGFTSLQVTEVLRKTPHIIDDDLHDLEMRFQYVFFHMRVNNYEEMVQARIFLHTLQHIHRRHIFMERIGVYYYPDRRGAYHTKNPSLAKILDSKDNRFVKICGVSKDEYETFCKVLELEEEGKRESIYDINDDEEGEDFDDGTDDDSEYDDGDIDDSDIDKDAEDSDWDSSDRYKH